MNNHLCADHRSRGFYVGPTFHHYRNYICFMSETKALQTSNTVDFPHITYADLTMTTIETLSMIMSDLLSVLKLPPIISSVLNSKWELATAITTIQFIFIRDRTSKPTIEPTTKLRRKPTIPIITHTNIRSLQSQPTNFF